MSFIDIRLPVDIERGAVGGPQFRTSIVQMGNGTEQRNVDWSKSKATWDIGYGVQSKEDYAPVRNHFMVVNGRAHTFRFRDHSDYQGTLELLGVGTGALTDFQLIRQYTVLDDALAAHIYTRVITRPVTGTIHLFKNGVESVAFTMQPLGVVRFTTAPALGVEVTATFDFDVPVRFDTDVFPLTLGALASGEITSLKVVEIPE